MPQLQLLPIMKSCYRWNLDYVRLLLVMLGHNKYVLMMIEYFFKWLHIVALLNKFNEGFAYAFLERILSCFGALAKVLTNQRHELLGEF
jgi:hypothetical protein